MNEFNIENITIKREISPIRDDEAEDPLLNIKKEENDSLLEPIQLSNVKVECSKKIVNHYENGQYCFTTDRRQPITSFCKVFCPVKVEDTASISGNGLTIPRIKIKVEKNKQFIAQSEKKVGIIVNKNKVYRSDEDKIKISCKKLVIELTKLHPCRDCSLAVPLQNQFSNDSKANPEDQHECPLCACSFITLESLWCHIYVHTRNKAHKCHICRGTFISSKMAVEHFKSDHPHIKIYQCDKCEYVTARALDFKRHVKTHGDKPHECPYCEYAAVQKYVLLRHLRIHKEERPYQCPHCIYAAKRSYNLQVHLQTHNSDGEKPYQCPHCKYASARKDKLKDHLRTHSEEKPFQCQHCEFASRHKRGLQDHLMVHSDEKKYQCPHCTYACRFKHSLQNHIRTHTNEKPYQCPHCEYSARSPSNLHSHITNIHKKRMPISNSTLQISSSV